ncbi:MAG: hypothetical protein IT360_24235 [Gemmatimonadaceae bacterium]|nr:hypothetical protein [Gemmatimonadaceae bacterium]
MVLRVELLSGGRLSYQVLRQRLAPRTVVLQGGRVVADGPTDEVLAAAGPLGDYTGSAGGGR